MKSKTISSVSGKVALAAASLCCVAALAGCAGTQPNDVTALDNREGAPFATEAIDEASTAMVVYSDSDQILFANESTGEVYIPALDTVAITSLDGKQIKADELEVGNIVEVTGNGIILKSFPAQYPTITAVTVVSQGTPADADKYASDLANALSGTDQSVVPTSFVQYTNGSGDVSLILNPFDYEWTAPGSNDKQSVDGDLADAQGALTDQAVDARISGATEVTVGFTATPTKVSVERTPLTSSDATAPTIDPQAEDESVAVSLPNVDAAQFNVEPGFAYEIEAEFANGEATYAFFAIN